MKARIFSIIVGLMVSSLLANGQAGGPFRSSVALLGGVNFQNLNGKAADGSRLENEMITGYHAGLNAQMPIAPEFYFQPGLLFSVKGGRSVDNPLTSMYRLSYIEMPLNLVYRAVVGDGFILLGFGPYVGYAVGGNVKYRTESMETNKKIEFTNEVMADDPLLAAYFRPLDFGGNILFGFEMPDGVFFHLNTQLGLVKINPVDRRMTGDQSSVKNTGFGLSLGYRL